MKFIFAAVLSALLTTLVSDSALAQTFLNKPAIEGITYEELAEWKVMYGSSSLFGQGGLRYGAPGYYPGICPPEPAYTCPVRKRTTRKGRK
jgi:hypothetical protein